jgi:hypothetical protein
MMNKTKREQAKARAQAAREAHQRQQTRAEEIDWDELIARLRIILGLDPDQMEISLNELFCLDQDPQ